jgi:hypothetical protein
MFFVDTRTLNINRRGVRVHIWKKCSEDQTVPAEFPSLKQARNTLIDIFDGGMHYFYGNPEPADLVLKEEI